MKKIAQGTGWSPRASCPGTQDVDHTPRPSVLFIVLPPLRNAALILLGVVLALGMLEIGARATYAPPWYVAVGDAARERAKEHQYGKNTDGLRGPEIGVKTRPRVVMLGDSFTYGWGVHDDAAVFPARVAEALNVEVVNGGLPGSLTTDWASLWQSLALRMRPDALVLVFFLRDGTRTSSNGMFDELRASFETEHAASLPYQWSAAYRLVRDRLDRRRMSDHYRNAFTRAYFGTDDERAEWTYAQRNLAAIVADARGRDIPVGFVVFPMLLDLRGAYPFADIVAEVLRFGDELGVPTLSLLPTFLGRDERTLWVSDVDQHPNAVAHGLAADALVPFVQRLLATH